MINKSLYVAAPPPGQRPGGCTATYKDTKTKANKQIMFRVFCLYFLVRV